MKNKKIISLMIFFSGLLILIYPMISRTYYDYYYRGEVKQIQEKFESSSASQALYQQQLSYNNREVSNLENIEVADVGVVEKQSTGKTDFSDENVIGTISIPAIDLSYPIYDGATNENLYKGVARIEGTSYPIGGINTNSVIAGHNGLSSKTYFSEITELKNGDVIEIQNRKERIMYEVYANEVIEPTNVSALGIIPGQDTLTLLTCTLPAPGTHRYLVYAKRIPNKNEDSSNSSVIENRDAEQSKGIKILERIKIYFIRYGNLVLVFLIGILAAYYIFIRTPNKD